MAMNEVGMHMNAGDGETSYTNNSSAQKLGISKSMHVLDEALKDMINDHKRGFPQCFKIVDLGCASGPNTYSIVSRIIDKIEELIINDSPEFEVFLSDLPQNDFNHLFKLLPDFYNKIKDKGTKCFVSGLPGSFYHRLFPTKSLHFLHSSYSLHWLSQVPEGLESNKENINMASRSPVAIFEAYTKQYRRDFSTFLSLRGAEMVTGGRMVLTVVGRSVEDPSSRDERRNFEILADTLVDMVAEGLIKEGDLHSFNLPIHLATKREIEEIVGSEGSFNINNIDGFLLPWDAQARGGNNDHHGNSDDIHLRGKLVSNFFRAFTEPILAAHFGSSIMDELFQRYAKKLEHHLSNEVLLFYNIVVCLSKR